MPIPWLRRVLRGDFARHGLLLFFATAMVNACNYLFHFVASRRLGPSAYGDLYALIAALGLLGVLSTAVTTVIVRLTAEFEAAGDRPLIASLLRGARGWSLAVAAAMALSALVLRSRVSVFLNLAHSETMFPWIVVLTGTVIVPPLRAVLQGLQDFRAFAISTSTEAVGKVVFGTLGIALGFGTIGALGGQALGIVAAWIYTELRLRGSVGASARRPLHFSTKRFIAVSGGVLGSTLATTALLSVDALLAKHYLSPADAGVYSAVSLSGKVLMFLVGFVPMVLLPKATHATMRGEPVMPFLLAGAGTSVSLAAVTLAIYAVAPTQVLHVMVGPAYEAAAPLLLPYGVAMALLALTNTLVAFKIAVHRFEFLPPLLLSAVAEAVGIVLHHAHIGEIVSVLIVAQAVALAVCLIPWNARGGHPYRRAVTEPTGEAV